LIHIRRTLPPSSEKPVAQRPLVEMLPRSSIGKWVAMLPVSVPLTVFWCCGVNSEPR